MTGAPENEYLIRKISILKSMVIYTIQNRNMEFVIMIITFEELFYNFFII